MLFYDERKKRSKISDFFYVSVSESIIWFLSGGEILVGYEITSVRLISSGRYDNFVKVMIRKAEENDILNVNLPYGLWSLALNGKTFDSFFF